MINWNFFKIEMIIFVLSLSKKERISSINHLAFVDQLSSKIKIGGKDKI